MTPPVQPHNPPAAGTRQKKKKRWQHNPKLKRSYATFPEQQEMCQQVATDIKCKNAVE